jgi:DNA-binding NtrC family response regulator
MDASHARVTVLLVDDEPLILTCLSSALRRAGFAVITACDAADALHIARSPGNLHALVTDFNMGKGRMNGVELAGLLQVEHPGLAVIVISASVDGERLARRHGLRFLAKPFTARTLAAHLSELRFGGGVVAKAAQGCRAGRTPAQQRAGRRLGPNRNRGR